MMTTQNEPYFRMLANLIPQCAWSATPAGRHDYFNERWYAYTGMPEPPAAGGVDHWRDYLHPEDLPRVLACWDQSLRSGERYSIEYRLRRKDGVYRWFLARAMPLRDESGAIVKWFGTLTDIHEQKQAHQTMLASERVARSEAERQTRLKDEFVATLSHELRTPLNAILGWVQILRNHQDDPETLAHGLEVIERNGRIQAQMVDDLLDMSRILSGKLRLDWQTVDLAVTIAAAINTVRFAAEAKNVKVVAGVTGSGTVQGDPARLQQVLWNLLTNAIKFTPEEGRIEVSLDSAADDWEVSIRDTGVGIEDTFLPYVFERFSQCEEGMQRRHGGLGLGLSIVKHLVELHQGSVSVESPGAGRGSTFRVRLPKAKGLANPAVSVELPTAKEVLGGLTILVVDDEKDARELVSQILRDARAQVVLAESAERAREQLCNRRVDVILSDLSMPGEDGVQFMRELRLSGNRIPAAAVTALARSQDRERALLAGFQTHIPKPIHPGELVAVVESLSGRGFTANSAETSPDSSSPRYPGDSRTAS